MDGHDIQLTRRRTLFDLGPDAGDQPVAVGDDRPAPEVSPQRVCSPVHVAAIPASVLRMTFKGGIRQRQPGAAICISERTRRPAGSGQLPIEVPAQHQERTGDRRRAGQPADGRRELVHPSAQFSSPVRGDV